MICPNHPFGTAMRIFGKEKPKLDGRALHVIINWEFSFFFGYKHAINLSFPPHSHPEKEKEISL
jgi:hypothetical protein